MSFEALRVTYQCPERLARHLYDELGAARAEIAQAHAMISLIEAQRDKLKKKLAPPPARRIHRGEN